MTRTESKAKKSGARASFAPDAEYGDEAEEDEAAGSEVQEDGRDNRRKKSSAAVGGKVSGARGDPTKRKSEAKSKKSQGKGRSGAAVSGAVGEEEEEPE